MLEMMGRRIQDFSRWNPCLSKRLRMFICGQKFGRAVKVTKFGPSLENKLQ